MNIAVSGFLELVSVKMECITSEENYVWKMV